jgi:glycerophosphoryl diester phosphodiesterase
MGRLGGVRPDAVPRGTLIGMWIIGHRGASGGAPENTLAAFRLAADLGAQAIETDLQLTRDGRLVLMHDDQLQRTTNGRGVVTAKNFDELRKLDAGSWFPKRIIAKRRSPARFAGEAIPCIEELFELARERDIGLYLEMKAPCAPGAEKAVVAAIHAAGAIARSTVICFDLGVLQRVREIDSNIALGYLFNKKLPDAVARAVSAGAKVILPRADRVTAELVAEAKRRRLQVVTWTVNDPKIMKHLMGVGVDGIMSDFPDRLAGVLRGA